MTNTNFSFWGADVGNQPDLLCGRSGDSSSPDKRYFMMLLCSTITLGGFLRTFLKNSEVAVLTVLSLVGFLIGWLSYNTVEMYQVVYPLLRTSSYSLYCYVSPLIIFLAALDVDFYILKNALWQVLLTGVISFSVALITIAYVVMKFNNEGWDLQSCLLFSVAVSIIDPIYSVVSLKNIGISKVYTDIIRGEAMIIGSVAYILFGFFRSHFAGMANINVLHVVLDFNLSVLGSIIFGYWCSRIIEFVLTDLFSNTLTSVVVCVSMVYLTFYVAEFCKMSGMMALITVGLKLDSLSFKLRMELIITKFLIMFSSVCQYLIYTFFGIVLGCGETKYFRFYHVTFTLILFATVNIVRLLTIMLVSPLLMYLSYKHSWKWGVILAWSGIKGVFNLLLAPEIYNVAQYKPEFPQMFILYVQAISLITMGVNSYMMTYLARKLGMCDISLPRQMAMQNAINHVQEIIHNSINLLKTEKVLTNVNWSLVEEKTMIEYSIPSRDGQVQDLSPDGKKQESPTDEVLIEEARLHVAIIQMRSFEKQYQDGILDKNAARILIGATKSYCPIQGKFMNIQDVATYMKARSWLIKLKKILTKLEYRKNKALFIPYLKSKFMVYVYYIVFSEEFEYAGHIRSLIYIYPMIIHLWPAARKFNTMTLIVVNYYFVFLYVLESTLKIIIMKRRYFYQYWNTLEFFITLVGIADSLCVYFVEFTPNNLVFIQITVVLGIFRTIRFIPLIKIIIPPLIHIVNVQMKKHVSLMYSITKGFVKSQEDTKFIIKQISGRESVYQKLHEILDHNKREAIKELEHKNRDIVLALKTRQTIQTVVAKALKHLSFLWSRGVIEKHEGIEMKMVLLSKIKALKKFPMEIPPPTPEKYLPNIVWLENKDVLIEFFKEKAELAYFDYGDAICREGEMPQGIYLIISGMAILHSLPPTFGIDGGLRSARESQTMLTEYCTSGDVIGELCCLLKHENNYTAICETTLQACFISVEDLYEGFDVFWPSLEYKIWLKLVLITAHRYFDSVLADEDLTFQNCVEQNMAYVETLSRALKMPIDNATMKFVIVTYGSVIDTKTEVPYLAPCILPETCRQVQGASELSKLLVVQASKLSSELENGSHLKKRY